MAMMATLTATASRQIAKKASNVMVLRFILMSPFVPTTVRLSRTALSLIRP